MNKFLNLNLKLIRTRRNFGVSSFLSLKQQQNDINDIKAWFDPNAKVKWNFGVSSFLSHKQQQNDINDIKAWFDPNAKVIITKNEVTEKQLKKPYNLMSEEEKRQWINIKLKKKFFGKEKEFESLIQILLTKETFNDVHTKFQKVNNNHPKYHKLNARQNRINGVTRRKPYHLSNENGKQLINKEMKKSFFSDKKQFESSNSIVLKQSTYYGAQTTFLDANSNLLKQSRLTAKQNTTPNQIDLNINNDVERWFDTNAKLINLSDEIKKEQLNKPFELLTEEEKRQWMEERLIQRFSNKKKSVENLFCDKKHLKYKLFGKILKQKMLLNVEKVFDRFVNSHLSCNASVTTKKNRPSILPSKKASKEISNKNRKSHSRKSQMSLTIDMEDINDYSTNSFMIPHQNINDICMNNIVTAVRMDSPKIVFDFNHEYLLNEQPRGAKYLYEELHRAILINKQSPQPFQIHFSNYKKDSFYNKTMTSQVDFDNSLVSKSEKNFIETFPKKDLIYLTSHSMNVMTKYDPTKTLIMGNKMICYFYLYYLLKQFYN
jgi:hypothetical protein